MRLACVSAAQAHGLDVLREPDRLHLWAPASANVPRDPEVRWHRSIPLQPSRRDTESILDLLGHVAVCLPHVEALIIWESALRRGLVSRRRLARVPWRRLDARRLREEAGDLSDSLLETVAVDALRHAGIRVRQQVAILGHRVDALVGEGLVLQFDGHAFHSSAGDRRRDAEHDARLQIEGFHVLRFTTAQVLGATGELVDTVSAAIGAGLHR